MQIILTEQQYKVSRTVKPRNMKQNSSILFLGCDVKMLKMSIEICMKYAYSKKKMHTQFSL